MGTTSNSGAIEVFFSYAHADEELRNKLEKYLSLLKHQGFIATWHDRRIEPGTEWLPELDQHLESADIILLLVRVDFLASEYCYQIEMKRAMARHDARQARVIPILLRSVDGWEDAPFGKLQALPTNGTPITSWPNEDEAFTNVARGIRKAVDDLAGNRQRGRWAHLYTHPDPTVDP